MTKKPSHLSCYFEFFGVMVVMILFFAVWIAVSLMETLCCRSRYLVAQTGLSPEQKKQLAEFKQRLDLCHSVGNDHQIIRQIILPKTTPPLCYQAAGQSLATADFNDLDETDYDLVEQIWDCLRANIAPWRLRLCL